MNTLTIGKLHKIIVHKHYNKIIDIDGYRDPKRNFYSEHIDVFITEPFLVLEIKNFFTGYDNFYRETNFEPWVKILIPNKNIVCWVQSKKLTMWSKDENASIVEL